MKYWITLIILLTNTNMIIACDCVKVLQFLQEKTEQNQASYQHQVIQQNRIGEYIEFKNRINQYATKSKSKRDCIGLIAVYQNYIRDEHGFIMYNEGFNSKKLHKKFKKKSNHESDIDGFWNFQDGSFSIKVTTVRNTFIQHIAVIEHDFKTGWKKNQVKIEFFYDMENKLKCIYWFSNLLPKVFDVELHKNQIKIGRLFTFHREEVSSLENQSEANNNFEFRELSVNTNYLNVPSFDLSMKSEIEKLVKNNIALLSQKENLIIDVRNNRGGGFDAFKPLLTLVSESEIVEPPYYGTVWVSPDNFKYYNDTKYEYAESKVDSLEEQAYVNYLQNYVGTFTPIEIEKDTIRLLEGKLKNIAIIFNRNSASTTEGFILTAAYSKKVKTYGEHSMGAVSYGDWMPVKLEEIDITVAISTAKMVFKNNEDFESIGIVPDFDLTKEPQNKWIELVVKKLENE